jgi:hypothetical protein
MASVVVSGPLPPSILGNRFSVHRSDVRNCDSFHPHTTFMSLISFSQIAKGYKKVSKVAIVLMCCLQLWACIMDCQFMFVAEVPKGLHPAIGGQNAKVLIRPIAKGAVRSNFQSKKHCTRKSHDFCSRWLVRLKIVKVQIASTEKGTF